jgi:hypothetical protein
MTGIGLPKDADAKSSGGTDLFGEDYFREYHQAYMCPLSCGYWIHAARAGPWALSLRNGRAHARSNVGFRCACYPDRSRESATS